MGKKIKITEEQLKKIIASKQVNEDVTDDQPYEKGPRGMKASRSRAHYTPTPKENEILNNLFGQYGEDIPPIVIRYLRKLPRKMLLNRLIKVGLIDKNLFSDKETQVSEQTHFPKNPIIMSRNSSNSEPISGGSMDVASESERMINSFVNQYKDLVAGSEFDTKEALLNACDVLKSKLCDNNEPVDYTMGSDDENMMPNPPSEIEMNESVIKIKSEFNRFL